MYFLFVIETYVPVRQDWEKFWTQFLNHKKRVCKRQIAYLELQYEPKYEIQQIWGLLTGIQYILQHEENLQDFIDVSLEKIQTGEIFSVPKFLEEMQTFFS